MSGNLRLGRPPRSETAWGKGGSDGSFTICFPIEGLSYPLLRAYTYGRVEVLFEALKNKPPFDDEAKRLELYRRLTRFPASAWNGIRIKRDPASYWRRWHNVAVSETLRGCGVGDRRSDKRYPWALASRRACWLRGQSDSAFLRSAFKRHLVRAPTARPAKLLLGKTIRRAGRLE